MARAFEITAAANRVQLGGGRKAQTSFTVSNVLGRPVRGRLRVVPEGGADPGWFTVSGPETRDFAAGATDQVRVDLAVPAGVDAGDYPFRLDVIAEENPDELSARGQSVHLQVPASEPEEKPFPWWIVAVAAAVLLVAAVGIWWALSGDDDPQPETAGVVVPNLEPYGAQGAQRRLEEAGLVARYEMVTDTEADPGTLLRWEPKGESVEKGSKVVLYVAAPEVPDLQGETLAEARDRLGRQRLGLARVYEIPGQPSGMVSVQDPEAGRRMGSEGAVGVVLAVQDSWVKARAQLSVDPGEAVDADEGTFDTGADDDFLFRQRDGRPVLEPRNQALLGEVPGDDLATMETCKNLDLRRRPVDLQDLEVGSQLCVRTGKNRFSRVRLAEPVEPDAALQVQVTTWKRENERTVTGTLIPVTEFRVAEPQWNRTHQAAAELLQKAKEKERQ